MSDPRTAREALLAELMGDMDQLLERQEKATAAANAAAERLEAAAKTIALAAAANAEAAKTSVGDFITRRVNEATGQAVQDARKTIDEAIAAALGKAVLAGQATTRPAPPAPANARIWMAFAAGVAVAAGLATLAWFVAR